MVGYASRLTHPTRAIRESECLENPPHPDPLPARGERERETSLLRAHFCDFSIAGQIIGTLAIDRIHHHALAVLQRGLANEGAERRLMIDLAERNLAKR